MPLSLTCIGMSNFDTRYFYHPVSKLQSVRAEDIRFAPNFGSLESIQVMQARVRVRADRARRRRTGVSLRPAHCLKRFCDVMLIPGLTMCLSPQIILPRHFRGTPFTPFHILINPI